MTTENTPIVISLGRELNACDQKAITSLQAKWLVYDVKISRKRSSAEIKLFHTTGAAPDLIREVHKFFPNETVIGA